MHVRDSSKFGGGRFYSSRDRRSIWAAPTRTLWAAFCAYLFYRGVSSARRHLQRAAQRQTRDANLDRTLADSFPASDPPSTIPDPASDPD